MDLCTVLKKRLSLCAIRDICATVHDGGKDSFMDTLFGLIGSDDDRVGYNALWIFTHLSSGDKKWLWIRRNVIIDMLLVERHVGKRRLMLVLLEGMPVGKDDIRTDYLDFCLSKINSSEPYAIRAFCLKQAYALCRLYPELLAEFKEHLAIMEYGELSPGLLSARRNILKAMRGTSSNVRKKMRGR